MKKHPIDDFFAERLSNHEVIPSDRAFELFQNKINEEEKKKRGVFWIFPKSNYFYYGSAACVLLVLGIYFNNSSLDLKSNNVLSSAISPKSQNDHTNFTDKKSSFIPKRNEAIALINEDGHKSPSINGVSKNNPKTFFGTANQSVITKNSFSDKVTNSIAQLEIDEPLKDNLTLALNTESAIQSPIINESQILSQDNGETLLVISSYNESPEESVYIPSLNSDSNLTLAEANAYENNTEESSEGIFAKVFNELKHLKHGEKIDIENVAADFKLDEESFLVSETRQIREKWSQLKNLLTKN